MEALASCPAKFTANSGPPALVHVTDEGCTRMTPPVFPWRRRDDVDNGCVDRHEFPEQKFLAHGGRWKASRGIFFGKTVYSGNVPKWTAADAAMFRCVLANTAGAGIATFS